MSPTTIYNNCTKKLDSFKNKPHLLLKTKLSSFLEQSMENVRPEDSRSDSGSGVRERSPSRAPIGPIGRICEDN